MVGESKEGTPKTNGIEDEAGAHESSELSEVPGSDAENGGLSSGKRSKESRRKTQAKERELARAKLASAKQAIAEHRRLDEEVNKLERRLEGIEREFRKLLGAVRVKPLGRDRFYNRIWWFDGMGSASLIGSGGTVQYGTGRIFIQGPSEFDIEVVQRRDEDVTARRLEEEGEEGTLGVGEWAVYDDIETVSGLVHTSHRNRLTAISKVDQFVAWLNPKGVRELALKNTFTKWWPHIGPGMRRRSAVRTYSPSLTVPALISPIDRIWRILPNSPRPDAALERNIQGLTSHGSLICFGPIAGQSTPHERVLSGTVYCSTCVFLFIGQRFLPCIVASYQVLIS